MKGKLYISLLSLTLVLFLIVFACRKSNTSNGGDTDVFTPQSTCLYSPDYGDTLFFTKYKGPNNDYTIKPKNDSVAGTYIAWPDGLVIDATTGVINVSQSETGMRYTIGFIQAVTHDTCVSKLIL